jgi:hypothetical protein
MRPQSGWVMCEGATRTIDGLRVSCPIRGSLDASQCLDCHLLVAWSGERRVGGWCAAPEEGLPVLSAPQRMDRTSGAAPAWAASKSAFVRSPR